MAVAPYDLAPIAGIALVGALLALVPVAWVWRRERGKGASARLQALTVLALCLNVTTAGVLLLLPRITPLGYGD